MVKRDTNAFRLRFERWKNGELVYDKGRPINYSTGKDDENDPSLDSILRRATRVHNNYSDAKDFDMNPFVYGIRKVFNAAGLRSGISNCTLTATLWIDPKNPIKSAASIFDLNKQTGYRAIKEEEALPGDLLITRNPVNGSFHTMLIESYDKNNKPILRYSTGGASQKSLKSGIPLDTYHNLDVQLGGNHTEDHYFRYNVPIYTSIEPVVIKPKNKMASGFEDGKDSNRYNQPETFLGSMTRAITGSAKYGRTADIASATALLFPQGMVLSVLDLGRDANRAFHGENGAKLDMVLDTASMLPFVSKLGLKTIRAKSFTDALKLAYNGSLLSVRTPINAMIASAIGADYVDDTLGADQTTYKNGKDSGIHIKPSHRGKFTALKKRTGHSASWFKAHGTPALKKMATFALNARKWKH